MLRLDEEKKRFIEAIENPSSFFCSTIICPHSLHLDTFKGSYMGIHHFHFRLWTCFREFVYWIFRRELENILTLEPIR